MQKDWQYKFKLLKSFKEKNGHVDIPKGHITKCSVKLYGWTNDQRSSYVKKTLPKERIKQLKSIGFIFSKKDKKWNDSLILLKSFGKKNGHTNIPIKHVTECGPKLGHWANRQRKDFKSGQMRQDRIDRLLSIDFVLYDLPNVLWQHKFELLKSFGKENGHMNIPRNHVTDCGVRLGDFAQNQKVAYSKVKLGQKRINLLNTIGFIW